MKALASPAAVWLFVVIISSYSLSQAKSVKHIQNGITPSTADRKNQPKYLETAFDISVSKVEPNFAGHDIVAILRTIAQSQPPRDTTMADGRLAFVLQYWRVDDFPHYDARKQVLKIKLTAERVRVPDTGDEMDTLPVRFINTRSESYFATNSYGDLPLVQRYGSTRYGLAFKSSSWLFPVGRSKYRESTLLVPMRPDKAKAFRRQYPKLVLVCRMQEPWRHHFVDSLRRQDGNHATGRITNDYQNVVQREFLSVVPEQLWVVDSATGEVLKKFVETR